MKTAAPANRTKSAPVGPPGRAPYDRSLASMQRGLGNRGTQLLLGAVDAPAERDADRVADRLMAGMATRVTAVSDGVLQRACSTCSTAAESSSCPTCDEGETVVRRSASVGAGTTRGGGAVPAHIEAGIHALKGGGRPLPSSLRTRFEEGLGTDLSRVRVHTGSPAEELARSLGARAFTIGEALVFGSGEYQPALPAGQRLLAHEVAHVVQQSRGAQAGMSGVVQRTACDDARRLQAERAGAAAEAAPAAPAHGAESADRWATAGRGIDFVLGILEHPVARATLGTLTPAGATAQGLRLFRAALPQLRQIWEILSNPPRLMSRVRQLVDGLLPGVPEKAREFLRNAAFEALRETRHLFAVGLGLTDAVAELLGNWTAPFVTAWNEFIHPFDVRAELADLECIRERYASGEIGAYVAFTAVYGWLVGWINRYSVYVGIALVAGGAAVGALAGGVGAAPGAGAGYAIAEEIGIAVLALNVSHMLLQVGGAVARLRANDRATEEDERQGRTPTEAQLADRQRQDEESYKELAHVLLGLGIMGACVLLGTLGPKLATAAVVRLSGRYPALHSWLARTSQRLEQSTVGRAREGFQRGYEGVRPRAEARSGERERRAAAPGVRELDSASPGRQTAPPPEPAEVTPTQREATAAPTAESGGLRRERLRDQEQQRARSSEALAREAREAETLVVIGEHRVKATRSGNLVICSDCTWLRQRYAREIAENPDFARRLREGEARAASGPIGEQGKQEIAALARELEGARRSRLVAEGGPRAVEHLAAARRRNFERRLAPDEVRSARPPPGSGTSGHARSKHGITAAQQAELLNQPERIFSGINPRGREVDIYYRQGSVVITEAGMKESVITAYGSFEVGGSAVDPIKWASDPRYVEVRAGHDYEIIFPNRERWERGDFP